VGFHGFGLWNVHTPKAFFELLLPNISQVSWLLALLVSAISIAIAWRISRRSRGSVATMFPAAVFLSLWASPHTLIYEWALLIAACVVLWENFPERRDAWLCLFVPTWIALTISTTFALVQIRYLHLPVVVQVSVPIMGVVGWLSARELAIARSRNEQQ